MKDKEEAEIVNSFQDLAAQYEKLQNIDLSNLSKLIKDRLKELIEEADKNSEKVRLAKMYEIRKKLMATRYFYSLFSKNWI